MKKILMITSKFILAIAFLNIFAYSIRHVYVGGTRFGVFTNILKDFSEFPTLINKVQKQLDIRFQHFGKKK